MSGTPDRKVLFLRDMPTELVREAKAAAARRGQTLTSIVSEALARSLAGPSTARDPAHELQRDMDWYRKHKARLLKRYSGEYIAIVDGAVVDHATAFEELARRVFARYGRRAIYMPRVQAEARELRVRSPRRTSA